MKFHTVHMLHTFNEMYEACELFYPSLMSLNNLPVPNKTYVCVCRLAICPADLNHLMLSVSLRKNIPFSCLSCLFSPRSQPVAADAVS